MTNRNRTNRLSGFFKRSKYSDLPGFSEEDRIQDQQRAYDADSISATSPAQANLQTRVPGALNLEEVGKHVLTIGYLPAGYQVSFPAFITQFSDAYNSSWNSEKVFGRMDPMGTFMHTKRNISLAFDVPAESFEHAEENLFKVNKLISFLYPVYQREKNQDIGVMNQDPFWQVRFGNLIQNSKNPKDPLLGFVNGITVDPTIEDGFFNRIGPTGKAEYYPKNIRLNFEFTVMHEHPLGFEASVGAREPVKVSGKLMDKTVVTYRFNDPKLSFGNFPYVTSQFAEASRSNQNIIPQNALQPPAIRSDQRRGDPPDGTAVVTMYDIWRRQIIRGEEGTINFETLLEALEPSAGVHQIDRGELGYLLQLDYDRASNWGRTHTIVIDPKNVQLWEKTIEGLTKQNLFFTHKKRIPTTPDF